jgi:hypothetical protein
MFCMCGNVFKSAAIRVNDSICNVTCPGKSSQMCGGFIGPAYYVSVYESNYSKRVVYFKIVFV